MKKGEEECLCEWKHTSTPISASSRWSSGINSAWRGTEVGVNSRTSSNRRSFALLLCIQWDTRVLRPFMNETMTTTHFFWGQRWVTQIHLNSTENGFSAQHKPTGTLGNRNKLSAALSTKHVLNVDSWLPVVVEEKTPHESKISLWKCQILQGYSAIAGSRDEVEVDVWWSWVIVWYYL